MTQVRRHDRLLRWLGGVAVVLSLVLLSRQALRHAGELPPIEWRPALFGVGLATLGLYLLARLLQALAWRWLLAAAGQPSRWWQLLRIGLLTEVGKYVPSNLAHYAGRVELLHRQGPSRALVLRTMVQEVALLVVAALAVAGAAAWWWPAVLAPLTAHLPRGRIAIALAGLAVLVLGLGWFGWRGRRPEPRRLGRTALRLLPCCGLYGLFLILNGLPLGLLAGSLYGLSVPWGALIGVWAVAWVVGFATPGAPAGLGVRDLLLLTALSGFWGSGPALAITAGHRLLLTVADGLAFFLGLLLGKWR